MFQIEHSVKSLKYLAKGDCGPIFQDMSILNVFSGLRIKSVFWCNDFFQLFSIENPYQFEAFNDLDRILKVCSGANSVRISKKRQLY